MTFYKMLATCTVALSIFSSNVFSMQNEEDLLFSEESTHSSISVPIKEDIEEITAIKNEESSSHWGLTRWVNGIGEYIQRSLCLYRCFDKRDPERKYIVTEERNRWEIENGREARILASSDCFLIHGLSSGNDDTIECIRDSCLIPCCPLATLTHLCCLPFACCENSKQQKIRTRNPRFTYTRTQEQIEISRQESVRHTHELAHSACVSGLCLQQSDLRGCPKNPRRQH